MYDSQESVGLDYSVVVLFFVVIFVGVMLCLLRKPILNILESEVEIEFNELGMDDAEDVEVGPGIMLVSKAKMDEKFVLDDSGTESEGDST